MTTGNTEFTPRLARNFADTEDSPVRALLDLVSRPGVISFAGGIPDSSFFDLGAIRAAYEASLARPERSLQYSSSEGELELREVIAANLTSEGIPSQSDDILITTGSQQGLTLMGQVMVDKGDVILVEDPTYLAALQTFGLAGARFEPVECDDEGVIPEALDRAIAAHRPKLVYLIPSYQNPSGRTMSARRRHDVAQILLRTQTMLIEDDPYSSLRYSGEALEPICAIEGMAEQTALLQTLSKSVAPGIRLGWARVPSSIRDAMIVGKQAIDLHSSTVDQYAAAYYLAHPETHQSDEEKLRVYGERLQAMVRELPQALPEGSRVTSPQGGMFLWAELPEAYDTDALLPYAMREGVGFVPGSSFHVDTSIRNTMRISFVTNAEEEIVEGVARLGRAVAAYEAEQLKV
ncbi:PLP-dependent aminotransferase family protein [Kocuria sp. TGY1127_2]|uniref:aminotransferase-like domain-containing protein n=1 Tax=Kocuria sp. TGY1127_2 TaxID=2711328 RepID=UPI0015C19E1D|nr:PLP-dependent aminotransferase family protein [Kocuria sp. TGY1127_2]